MSKSVKICHLTSVHSRNDIRIFQKECKSLAKHGFDVHLICQKERDTSIEGVSIHGLRAPSSRLDRIFNLSKECYKKAIEIDCDLYHIHDPELLPIALKLKRKGKVVVYDAHENAPASILDKEWIPIQTVRRLVSKLFENYELKVSKKLDAVISVAEPLLNRFANKERVLIRILPILDNFKDEKLSDHLQSTEKGAVYAGGLTAARNIMEMIEGVGKSKKVKALHLFGAWESKDYMNSCKQLKGWEKVYYWGFIDNKQVYSFLKEKGVIGLILFDKGIRNHEIALPNKAFEYMAAGLPILMSDIPYWKENFHKTAKFTNPSDSEEIARCIDNMIANEEELGKQIRNGLLEVNTLNWQKESKELIDLYSRLLIV